MNKKYFTHPALTNDADELIKFEIPSVKVVCPQCGGNGTHSRTDIDDSLLVDTMCEDHDYEGLSQYYRGDYDVTCECCHGANVIDEWDWDYFQNNYPDECLWISQYQEQVWKDNAYAAQERACGA